MQATLAEAGSVTSSGTALAIVGSRNYSDYSNCDRCLQAWMVTYGRPTIIISGGAPGVDTVAASWAFHNNIPCQVFPADWSKYGKRAGPIRNSQIVTACTHVVAFPTADSKGTRDTINKARAAGKIVVVYEV